MAQCPNCGAAVGDGATMCENCGASLAAGQQGQGQPPQQGGRQAQGGGQGGQQPPQGQGGQQPPQGQPGQQPQQARGGGRQQQAPPPGGGGPGGRQPAGGGGESRRDLLKYGGGAAVLGIGGFLIWDNVLSGGGPGDGPAGIVKQFYQAINNGNFEKASSLVHPDSPMKGNLEGSMGMMSEADISVESTEVTTKEEERAEVDVTLSISMGGQSNTNTDTIELRKHEGDWKLYG